MSISQIDNRGIWMYTKGLGLELVAKLFRPCLIHPIHFPCFPATIPSYTCRPDMSPVAEAMGRYSLCGTAETMCSNK